MQFTVASALLLLGQTSPAVARSITRSPVEKVVNLLNDLKARLESDGASEQQTYDKYACWCEKTTARKAKAIDQGRLDLRSYGQEILIQRGLVAQKTIEIEQTTTDIKDNEEAQEGATSIRQKENQAYMAESTEMKQATAALEAAVTVLREATGFLQQGASSSASARAAHALASVQDALASVPSAALASRLALLSRFQAEVAKTKGTRYAPQSATITGILRDMYDSFAGDLESMDGEESDKNRAFEDFIATKQEELILLQEKLEAARKAKAEAELLMAEAEQAYDDTEAQVKADIEFFDATKSACTTKSEDWATRKQARTEELAAVTQAITLLSSDDARELFGRAVNQPGMQTSLLQVSNDEHALDTLGAPALKAYKTLKALATQGKSLRLAVLATRVRSAKVGHFEQVLTEIDALVAELKQDTLDDIKKRDQCKDEYQSIESKTKDLEWKLVNNDAAIAKFENQIEKLETEKTETIEQINATAQVFIDLNSTRQAENQVYTAAKTDDEEAVALLEQAKDGLKKFYENRSIELGPMEGGEGTAFLQAGPDFEKSADDAPDADFSKEGKRKQTGKGVVALLMNIIEDLHGELAQGKAAEEAAQLEYEAQYKAAEELLERLEAKKASLDTSIAERGVKLSDENNDKTTNDGDLTSEQAYKQEIKPDCDFVLNNWREHSEKAAAEIEGLNQAKEYLAGYQEKAAAQDEALLQGGHAAKQPRPVKEAAFGRIGFHGLD